MIVIGISLIILFGYKLSNVLIHETNPVEKIALGYILGLGIFTFIWFLLGWAGVPYNLVSGLLLLIVLNLITLFTNKLKFGKWFEKPKFALNYFRKTDYLEKISLGITTFLFLSALIQNIYWPVRHWDSLVLYDFRAKIFALTGSMQPAISQGYFFGYPLLTSLSHTWVYLLGVDNPSFIYGLLYINFITVIFFNFKKLRLSKLVVFGLTLLMALSPRLLDHTQWAYTNLPYSIYIVLGSIYLYLGVKNKNLGLYILSALLIGLSTWTRSAEPFWLAYVLTAFFSALYIRRRLWSLAYIGLVALLIIPWRFFEETYGMGSANIVGQVASTSSAIAQSLSPSILKSAFSFFFTNVIAMYLSYFVLFAVIILIKFLIKSKKWFFTILIILNVALSFAGTIFFVKNVPFYQDIPDSMARMMMFVPSMIIFLIGLNIEEIGDKKNEK